MKLPLFKHQYIVIFKLLFQLVRIATIINNALSLNQQILDRFWIKIKHNQTLFLDSNIQTLVSSDKCRISILVARIQTRFKKEGN